MHDDSEKHLIKEVEVIQGALALLVRTKEQIVEQIRCVKSSLVSASYHSHHF